MKFWFLTLVAKCLNFATEELISCLILKTLSCILETGCEHIDLFIFLILGDSG